MTMKIVYTKRFLRLLKKCEPGLIEEAKEKINQLRDRAQHKALKVHTLKGRLKGRSSFSVNYKVRILFRYLPEDSKTIALLAIGDHDVYKA